MTSKVERSLTIGGAPPEGREALCLGNLVDLSPQIPNPSPRNKPRQPSGFQPRHEADAKTPGQEPGKDS